MFDRVNGYVVLRQRSSAARARNVLDARADACPAIEVYAFENDARIRGRRLKRYPRGLAGMKAYPFKLDFARDGPLVYV